MQASKAPAWHGLPLHLTEEEIEHPETVIREILESMGLTEFRELTEEMMDSITDSNDLQDLRFVHKCMLRMFEACHLIYSKRKLQSYGEA